MSVLPKTNVIKPALLRFARKQHQQRDEFTKNTKIMLVNWLSPAVRERKLRTMINCFAKCIPNYRFQFYNGFKTGLVCRVHYY